MDQTYWDYSKDFNRIERLNEIEHCKRLIVLNRMGHTINELVYEFKFHRNYLKIEF